MTDAEFIAAMSQAVRATPQADLEARQLAQAPLMRALTGDERATLNAEGLRNIPLFDGSIGKWEGITIL